MTVRHCISLLLLASTASAQQQQVSSLRSTPAFEVQGQAATPPKQPTAAESPAAPPPKPAGGGVLPESLYKQQRVEYTFPVPVSLAPVQQDGNGTWCDGLSDGKEP